MEFAVNPSCRKGQDTAIGMASPHTACSQQQCSCLLDTPRCSRAGLTRSAFPASSRSSQRCSPGIIRPERSSPSAIVQYLSMPTPKVIYESCQCSAEQGRHNCASGRRFTWGVEDCLMPPAPKGCDDVLVQAQTCFNQLHLYYMANKLLC